MVSFGHIVTGRNRRLRADRDALSGGMEATLQNPGSTNFRKDSRRRKNRFS